VLILFLQLGDSKFKDKLAGIFNIIDRTVAGSKVAQYYQNFGITSTSAKTRAAAMEMLAQLIKRRGDIISSSGDGGKLYRRIAEFIGSPDNATRTAALDCIAYLYKIHGDAVFTALGELKSKDRDLLKKRIDKLASAPVKPSGIPAHVRQSPPRASTSQGSSSPVRTNSRGSSAASSPTSDHEPAPRRLSLKQQVPAPTAPHRISSELSQLPASDSRPTREMSSNASSATLVSNGSSSPISTIISNVLSEDPDRSVEALKRVQQKLERYPAEMQPYVQDLIEAVHIKLQHIFASPDSIREGKTFRLTKHLVQTLSNFCDHSELVEEVNPDNMMILLEQLTIGLLRTDMATGDVKEMSRYLNMTILRLFATGRRITIFK
jgi:cytoskeleton-associated protein 5